MEMLAPERGAASTVREGEKARMVGYQPALVAAVHSVMWKPV